MSREVRREGVRVGQILFSEIPNKYAVSVPEELSFLSSKDACIRLEEFQRVTERIQGLTLLSKDQIESQGYKDVSRLQTVLDGNTPPTLSQVLESTRSSDSESIYQTKSLEKIIKGLRRASYNLIPLHFQDTPQRALAMLLVHGYGLFMEDYVGNIRLVNLSMEAVYEVLKKDFPQSHLVRDFRLNNQDDSSSVNKQPPQVHEVKSDKSIVGAIALSDKKESSVTFDDAFMDEPKADKLPPYNGAFVLDAILDDYSLMPEVRKHLVGCELSELWWNPENIFPLVLEYASEEQKTFASDFYDLIVDTSGPLLFEELAMREKAALGDESTIDTLYEVINGKSPDSNAWWLFAPEIYKELVDRRGMTQVEAMQRVLLLAGSGDGFGPTVTMDGFSFLPDGIIYRLSRNSNGKSYEFTRLHAKTVADLLFENDNYNPDKAFSQ